MIKISRHLTAPAFKFSAIIIIVYSLVCTRIPLLNYLGFEFSALSVLLLAFLSGLLTLFYLQKYLLKSSKDYYSFLMENLEVQFVLLAIPLLVLFTNAFFVKNCSLSNGLLLYVLIVIPGAIFSISIATLIGILFNKFKYSIFVITYLIILSHIPIVTILKPQIFAFNPIIGFFPGFTYDETLEVTKRLLIYRCVTIAVSGFIIVIASWLFKRKVGDRLQSSLSIFEIASLSFLTPIILIVFFFSYKLGFSSSEEYIKQKLIGYYRTKHCDIFYSIGSVKKDKIEAIGTLHEFYYQKIINKLDLKTNERISSFLYASPEQKGRYIGARNTNIAKPWLRQIHINLSDIDYVLMHEMVHVLAGDFGWSPLKIANNPMLLEGLPVAMEGTSITEPIDQAAALVLAIFPDYDLKSQLKLTGFAIQNPKITYTLSGSFCKFLIENYGLQKFKDVYSGQKFDLVYHYNVDSLINMWKNHVKRININTNQLIKAKFFFSEPSIFHKECARIIANINEETLTLLNLREYERALISSEYSLKLSPSSDAIYQKAEALFKMQKYVELANFLMPALDKDSTFNLFNLKLRLGDALWALDSNALAKQEYETLLRTNLSPRYDEACLLRLQILSDPYQRNRLKYLFMYDYDDTTRISLLNSINSSISNYMLAKEYIKKDKPREAVNLLKDIEAGKLGALEYYRKYYLAKSYFELKDYKRAKDIFNNMLASESTPYMRIQVEGWINKCDFFANIK